ncbi:unnamed protein product [Zymoseptoria tritici ST99CH_1A5]|uniref:Uncharacterized protein n=2 Tax=Zymoseptoria tritici TaxID=1047171 RepID=A0A1X7S7D6_ZYMT9|nr:unnamed protein product [Zymoseptoria tritici ST99CH_3D7]SMY29008.1 unnamed protein product [Zymoseptoria tritici ST99CH_1A5]
MQHVTRRYSSRLSTYKTRRLALPTTDKPEETATLPSTTPSEDGSYTLRLRKHGNKALPLPSLFDPIKVAAREKHKAVKPPADFDSSNLTPFQQELQSNPYAHALATPTRQCVLTRARLPEHFLIPFISNQPPIPKPESQTPLPPQQQPQPTRPTLQPRIGFRSPKPSSYILARAAAFKHIAPTGTGKRKKDKWAVLVNQRMSRAWAQRKGVDQRKLDEGKDWIYDADMEAVVMEKLVTDVLKKLAWCAAATHGEDGSGSLVGLMEEVIYEEEVGAVLLLGEDGVNKDVLGAVPTYDLKEAVDEESLVALRVACELEEDKEDILVLWKSPKTVPTLLALELLFGFTGARSAVVRTEEKETAPRKGGMVGEENSTP